MSEGLGSARRLIVKIGSALLVDDASGDLRRDWLAALVEDVARCRARGQDVLIVSSGAIAVGRRHLALVGRALKLEEKQAAAATGQIRLAHAYQEALAKHGVTVAQILLTPDDTEERRRYLNARATLEQLIDGLYTADPRKDASARHIPEVRELTPEIEAMGGIAPAGYSSGGMVTKLAAARIAMAAGCRMVIARGERLHPLAAIEQGATCTWFVPAAEPRTARKRWIAGTLNPMGALVVDDGAAAALKRGTSLLPAGVVAVEGSFERGDPVVVRTRGGREVARGLSAYSGADARAIAGHKSGEIEAILGYRGRDEMIHRDDLVVSG